jgi:transcriptional regulator with XRE-family HTH domain
MCAALSLWAHSLTLNNSYRLSPIQRAPKSVKHARLRAAHAQNDHIGSSQVDVAKIRCISIHIMPNTSFAEYSRAAREKLDLSQKEFAKKIGTTFGVYLTFESGRSKPSLALVQKIAKFLGLGPKVLGTMILEFKHGKSSKPKATRSYTKRGAKRGRKVRNSEVADSTPEVAEAAAPEVAPDFVDASSYLNIEELAKDLVGDTYHPLGETDEPRLKMHFDETEAVTEMQDETPDESQQLEAAEEQSAPEQIDPESIDHSDKTPDEIAAQLEEIDQRLKEAR